VNFSNFCIVSDEAGGLTSGWRASLAGAEQFNSATKGETHETIKYNPERVRVAGHGSFAAELGADRTLPTQTVTLSGTVETIDREKRVVNIKTPDGTFQTIDVPPAAKRFDELKVGDKVSITYNNTVSARLKPPGEPPVDTVS